VTTQPDSPSAIVVGIDGSESSMQALGWALRQARLDGTPIEAVTAWQYPIIYGWALPSTEDYDHRHNAQAMLNAVIADVAGSDPTVTIHDRVVEGHAIRVLLDAARDAQLLVLGRGGDGSGRTLGSVSQPCTQHSPCPVVVVR
jgi:nucleotide-binding universal stress UspA family protein